MTPPDLWGKDTGDTSDLLKKELGDDRIRTLIIGPGGRESGTIAGVAHDLSHYHGRTGMGAVMGSKNLKAVVVRGSHKPAFADPDKIKQLVKFFADNFKANADNHGQNNHGTSDYYFNAQAAGSLPTLNFTAGHFDGVTYTVDEMHARLKVRTDGCYACPVRCKQIFSAETPYKIDPRYGGPEFETLAAFGSLCGVGQMEAAPKAHELCNRLGLDTVSTGAAIAFAMECFENGLLTREQLGGMSLEFGDAEAMLKMVEMIAFRKGFGDVLAEGVARAAARSARAPRSSPCMSRARSSPWPSPQQVRPRVGLRPIANRCRPPATRARRSLRLRADRLQPHGRRPERIRQDPLSPGPDGAGAGPLDGRGKGPAVHLPAALVEPVQLPGRMHLHLRAGPDFQGQPSGGDRRRCHRLGCQPLGS